MVKLKALNQELPIWRKRGEPGEGTERDNHPHRLNRLQRLSFAVQVLRQINAMFIKNVSSSWTNRSNHSDVFTIKTGAANMEENGSERRRAEISEKPYRRRGADKIGPKM